MNLKKRILVAPLNWGLGHAARCIPIIEQLQAKGFEPILASDGEALQLLQKEFPELRSISLPSYQIRYPEKGMLLKWKLLIDSPKILKAINAEKKIIDTLVSSGQIAGIISDNRFGVYHNTIPSVIITHQLIVPSGQTTWLSSQLHQKFIKSFDQCWVPDHENEPNLSGKLGHSKSFSVPIKYLGVISRFNIIHLEKKYDLMVVLSGPEPQRTLLENKILDQLITYQKKVLFIQGKMEQKQTIKTRDNVTIVNFMLAHELEKSFNESQLILARSGYTTLMDLALLKKKAFFIPTPGQFEQEYLATLMHEKGIAPFCSQGDFTLEQLNKVKDYNGFEKFETAAHIEKRLGFFEGE